MPNERGQQPVRVINLRNLAWWLLAAYLLWCFAASITYVLLLFALAALFAILLDPPVRWMARRGLSRGLAATLIAIVFLAALGGAAYFAVPPVADQAAQLVQDAPQYAEKLQDRAEDLAQQYPFLRRYLGSQRLGDELGALGSAVLPHLGRYSLSLLAAIGGAVMVFVLTLYGAAEPDPLVRGLLFALPKSRRKDTLRALVRIRGQLQGWLRATVLMMLIVGLMSGIGLWALGVKMPVLFGVIAAIGEAIPTIGPILSAIPPFLVTVADDPMKGVYVLLLFLAVQQIENNLLVPRIMASTMKLHPVSVLFSVLALGAIMGPIGVLLGTPICAIVKVLYQVFYRPGRRAGHAYRSSRVSGASSDLPRETST